MLRKRRRIDTSKPVLMTEDAAELLGLDTATIEWMVRTGRLPAYRFPGADRVYFLREEVAALRGR